MLSALRRSATRGVGLAILALASIALVFTLFQGQGPGSGVRPAAGAELAVTGGRAIGEDEFAARVRRALELARREQPALTMTDFVRLGQADILLEQLILGRALAAFAEDHGLVVGRRLLDGEIASLPAAQVAGRFDDNLFRRLLAEQRLTEAELREDLSAEVARRLLLAPASLGNVMPRRLATPFAQLLLEQRQGTIVAVPAQLMPDPGRPTDAQLQAFWQTNRQAYTVPERRAVAYAFLDPSLVAAAARPAPQAVRAYYDANPAEFGGLETRELRQVVLADEAAARAFAARVRGGTPFLEAARAEGFDASDTVVGVVDRPALEGQLAPEIAAAAFGVNAGGLAGPVRGPVGWHVLMVDAVNPPRPRPFESVAAGIEQRLMAEATENAMVDLVARIEDRIAEGGTLAAVARETGLTLVTTAALTKSQRRLEGGQLVPERQPLIEPAFDLDPAEGAQVVEYEPRRFAVIEVTSVEPAATLPVAAIRDRVAADWAIDQRLRAARAQAEELARAGSAADAAGMAALARQRGLPPAQTVTVRRLELLEMADQGGDVPAPIVLLLNTPAGQARVITAGEAGGWFVVRHDAARRGEAEQVTQLGAMLQQSFGEQAGSELLEAYARAIQRATNTIRRPEAIEAARRRLAGAPAAD